MHSRHSEARNSHAGLIRGEEKSAVALKKGGFGREKLLIKFFVCRLEANRQFANWNSCITMSHNRKRTFLKCSDRLMTTKDNKHVTRGSLSPETILSVKGSDSLPAPKPSSALVPSVGGSELSSSNISFLTGVKSVATSSPDST